MPTINDTKQSAESDSPLFLFECLLPDGAYQRFSSHAITFEGNAYSARVLKQNLFTFQLSSEDATDGPAQLSITLANADSLLSEIEAVIGWKGTVLTVYFVFADLAAGVVTTESTILFRGIAGDPDEIAEDSMRLTFANKLSLQRVGLPDVRVQRQCPWTFPANPAQRALANSGDRYSRYARCGYSADQPDGRGNLNNGQPFTSCDYSRASCIARGMFNQDGNGNITRRYGGFEFIPAATLVRSAGAKTSHLSPVLDNIARHNDYVPMMYGAGWLSAPVIFARNDGNLTHMEVLLGLGPIDSVLKVVVSDIEIPLAVVATDMTATGWYNIVTLGDAQGAFNPDFADSNNQPLGDPNGSMAVLSVVVPNVINGGSSVPIVEVLLQGMHLDRYNADGNLRDFTFTNNPAWIILDILRRAGWPLSEMNLSAFAQAAAFCETLIPTTDLNGNHITVERFQCNLIVTKRQSSAQLVRGVRVSAALMLRYGAGGLLELLPETTLASQQPTPPDGANSVEPLDGGWPAYEFSDGSGDASGIARDSKERSTVRLVALGIAELSNRLSVEFQDEANEYQQDSLSLVDDDDSALIGYEVNSVSTALGLPNFNQAARVLRRQLDKLTRGNQFIEFETSFRALKVRPGDIIAVTYLKEGLVRAPFRVVKLTPAANYRRAAILAQVHDDSWYSDDPSNSSAGGRQPGAGISSPRPLLGPVFNSLGATDFTIVEQSAARTDGGVTTTLSVAFVSPVRPPANAPILPLLSLSPQVATTGGALAGGVNYYYAISAVDAAGNEGMVSFSVRAAAPPGSLTCSVTLTNLSFPATSASCNVYRGTNPQLLYRIAANQPLAPTFVDTGLTAQPVGPPDPNFDYANFYYRLELAGPMPATVFSATVIGNADMNATPLVYAGMNVRIIAGAGAGHERGITSNDATTLTVFPAWSTIPDATSVFVVTENSWRFGSVAPAPPAQFEVPNQAGTVVEVSGRGANVQNVEGAAALCPVTRWVVGGGSGNVLDGDVAGAPLYLLSATGQGNLTVSNVGFASLANTRSVAAGTLIVVYWNELLTPSPYALASAMDAVTATVALNNSASPSPGDVIQIGAELMSVLSVDAASNSYAVVRQFLGTLATTHNAGDLVLHLQHTSFILPFARDFFENPASQNFAHGIHLPDVRVAASQFYVANSQGESQTSSQNYTLTPDAGLRTLSGGQFSLQVSGFLAVQQNAAPPLLVEDSHAPRDIRATVTQAPGDTAIVLRIWQDSTDYCELTILPGQTVSNIVDGKTLPPLNVGSTLRLDVVQVGQAWQSSPGRDLTVTIRL